MLNQRPSESSSAFFLPVEIIQFPHWEAVRVQCALSCWRPQAPLRFAFRWRVKGGGGSRDATPRPGMNGTTKEPLKWRLAAKEGRN